MPLFLYWVAILPPLILLIESFDEDKVTMYSIYAFFAALVVALAIPALGCLIITLLLARLVLFKVPGELYTSVHNRRQGLPYSEEPFVIAGAYVILLLLFFWFADLTHHFLTKLPLFSWNQAWDSVSDSYPTDFP